MCGVAGIVSLGDAPVEAWRLKAMCDALAHRGPDDAGYAFLSPSECAAFADPSFKHKNESLPALESGGVPEGAGFKVGLGHRRLSILDLSSLGHQPMSAGEGALWTSYNGEAYNFPDIRRGLEADGVKFRTRSDTEAILSLWERRGAGALKEIDGMFAIAVYDRRSNRVFLARDRFGVKPLYYAVSKDGGHLLFASEIKGLLSGGLVEARVNARGVAEYMSFQNIYSEDTLFESVKMVRPGEMIEIEPGGGISSLRRSVFHAESFAVDHSMTEADAEVMTASAFEAAVERQLLSDVEVGAYLSGGMDSGSIVAVAGRRMPRMLTFTGGFDLTNVSGIEQGFDERRMAERLAYLLQTEHYDVVLHAGDMPAAMERIAWHLDDPRVGMCHQNWYVSKLAGKFVKVCLAGAGGDELFGGYPWRYRQGMDCRSPDEFDKAYFKFWHRNLPHEELPGLLSGELKGFLPDAEASFRHVMGSAPEFDGRLDMRENLLQRALYFEYRTFLHGFLVVEDRISMAHGMESRVPFLDNELASLALRMPPRHKLHLSGLAAKEASGHMDSAEGKTVLRRAMRRCLPEEFLSQRKQGFSPPDENWFRGPSMDYIKQILHDPVTTGRPWFEQGFLNARLDEHFQGRRNHRLLIWSLLCFEWLQRHFMDSSFKGGVRNA